MLLPHGTSLTLGYDMGSRERKMFGIQLVTLLEHRSGVMSLDATEENSLGN